MFGIMETLAWRRFSWLGGVHPKHLLEASGPVISPVSAWLRERKFRKSKDILYYSGMYGVFTKRYFFRNYMQSLARSGVRFYLAGIIESRSDVPASLRDK